MSIIKKKLKADPWNIFYNCKSGVSQDLCFFFKFFVEFCLVIVLCFRLHFNILNSAIE